MIKLNVEPTAQGKLAKVEAEINNYQYKYLKINNIYYVNSRSIYIFNHML